MRSTPANLNRKSFFSRKTSRRTSDRRPVSSDRRLISAVERLEDRRMFALLGVIPSYPLTTLTDQTTGALTYTASDSKFTMNAAPVQFIPRLGARPIAITSPKSSSLGFFVNQSDGSFNVGIDGNDFTLTGNVTVSGTAYTGTLLTGEVTAFGFQDGGNTDSYDLRLTPTGGALLAPYFTGLDIGLNITSEASTFDGAVGGSGFTANFVGQVKATLGPVAKLPPAPKPATISGFVYADANNNGIKETGETPIANVPVTLNGTATDGTALGPITLFTDSTGAYTFTNLIPGTYTLTEGTVPSIYLDGKDTLGSLGSSSGTAGNDVLSGIALIAGDNGVNYNFGEILPASVSGTVFYDANNNGLQDSGDLGINNVAVTLTGTNDLGDITPITVYTNSDGTYSFPNLRPGTYTVTETQPVNYLQGINTPGNAGGSLTAVDVISGLSLSQGQSGINYNFAEILPASVSGFVYVDAGNDGIKDVSEAGIGNVAVTLSGTNDLGAITPITVYTNPDGSYSFINLRPGTYIVSEGTVPSTYLDGKDTAGSLGGDNSVNDVLSAVSLVSGDAGTDYNFGEILPASISGFVYVDLSNDGIKQSTEGGIGNIAVTLTGSNDLGNISPVTVYTNADGSYSFPNLRPGTYTVSEGTVPSTYLDGKDTAGNFGGDASSNDIIATVALDQTNVGTDYNFGEILPASIAGFVYVDLSNDGIKQSSEGGIGNIAVTLTGSDDFGSIIPVTVYTNADGSYSFPNLRPGTYTVSEGTVPTTYLDGKDTAGNFGGDTTTNDVIASVSLGQTNVGVNYNFGELLPSTISGFVYIDTNNDGIKQTSESGIGSTAVTLSGNNDLGNITPVTVYTNPDGSYAFPNLRPGTYIVTETQPANYLDGKDTAGTLGGNTAVNDVISSILLPSNTSTTDNNFGELLPATSGLSGYVYVDANNNGLFDSNESPIANVTVTLTGKDDLGNTVNKVAYTNNLGYFVFNSLRASNAQGYTLTETQPTNYLDGKDTAGTIGAATVGTVSNDVISNIVLPASSVGINYLFGERLANTASISGIKFRDMTGNGASSDDQPLGGITINLYRDIDGSNTLTSADGPAIATAVTTDGTGAYSFGSLPSGTYFVQEVVTSGYVQTNVPNSDTQKVVLTQGQAVSNINFYNYQKIPCNISSFYFLINNTTKVTNLRGNTNAGDTVQVVFTVPAGKTETATLVSYTAPGASFDANTASRQVIYDIQSGTFTAPANAPGTFTLTVLNPSSYYQVDFVCGLAIDKFGPAGSNIFYSAQGRLISADNDGPSAPVANVTSLSGFVFADTNNNGIFDQTEKGISGVKVTLAGGGLSAPVSVNTDSSGKYVFTNLPAGTYTITETQPSSYLDGKDSLGSNGGVLSNDVFSQVTVAPGNAGTNYNFGEVTPGRIQGLVYVDGNNNGQVDANEAGISGVAVKLTGTNDLGQNVNTTVYTDSNGNYAFDSLRPGNYTVTETQPANYTDGKDTIGTLGGNASVNDVFSQIAIGQGSNGLNYNFGELGKTTNLGVGMTATIGFWQNNNGQCLIKSLNGSANATNLGNWLAATFPNLFGAGSTYATAGKTNNQVAALFIQAFCVKSGPKTEAQAFAVALAIYSTNSNLAGGNYAASYKFKVDATGSGAALYNVGAAGTAIGLTNNTSYSLYAILNAVNTKASKGAISGDTGTICNLLSNINQTGDIK